MIYVSIWNSIITNVIDFLRESPSRYDQYLPLQIFFFVCENKRLFSLQIVQQSGVRDTLTDAGIHVLIYKVHKIPKEKACLGHHGNHQHRRYYDTLCEWKSTFSLITLRRGWLSESRYRYKVFTCQSGGLPYWNKHILTFVHWSWARSMPIWFLNDGVQFNYVWWIVVVLLFVFVGHFFNTQKQVYNSRINNTECIWRHMCVCFSFTLWDLIFQMQCICLMCLNGRLPW